MSEMSAEYLKFALDYDPSTGRFIWKEGRRFAGRVAGKIDRHGYNFIFILGKQRAAHRLAWLYAYGEFPQAGLMIDHINGVKSDNRLENLRVVTPSQNAQNRGRHIDGLKGASRIKTGRWQAVITPPSRGRIYLGLFDTAEEAHAAYQRAAEMFFGEYARGA